MYPRFLLVFQNLKTGSSMFYVGNPPHLKNRFWANQPKLIPNSLSQARPRLKTEFDPTREGPKKANPPKPKEGQLKQPPPDSHPNPICRSNKVKPHQAHPKPTSAPFNDGQGLGDGSRGTRQGLLQPFSQHAIWRAIQPCCPSARHISAEQSFILEENGMKTKRTASKLKANKRITRARFSLSACRCGLNYSQTTMASKDTTKYFEHRGKDDQVPHELVGIYCLHAVVHRYCMYIEIYM